MRVALVVNAASGRGADADRLAVLVSAAGADASVHEVEGHAIERAADAALAERPDRVAVAAGDGSIGPVALRAARAGVPLAVIPVGTANDFARALELPLDVEAACALAATGTRGRPVDVLRAGERPFVNAASIGLSVLAARRARPLKRTLGPVAYAVGALRAGVTGRPLRCRIAVDGVPLFDGAAWQAIVAGTGAFGAGSALEDADPADRLVDVAVLAGGPRRALVRRAWAMRSGGLAAQPGVRYARGRSVDLDVPPRTRFNVDGEICRVAPARVDVAGRVRVVCP